MISTILDTLLSHARTIRRSLGLSHTVYQSATGQLLLGVAASTTVSQTGTTVTVINGGGAGTAHNIPATTFDGYKVFFPGSASIPSGWYSGFARASTSQYTFQRTTATVSSESVNGGAAYTAETTLFSVSVTGGLMGTGGALQNFLHGSCNNTAGTKALQIKVGSVQLSYTSATSSASLQNLTQWRNRGVANSQVASRLFGANASAPLYTAIDTSVDFTLTFTGQAATANDYLAFEQAHILCIPS